MKIAQTHTQTSSSFVCFLCVTRAFETATTNRREPHGRRTLSFRCININEQEEQGQDQGHCDFCVAVARRCAARCHARRRSCRRLARSAPRPAAHARHTAHACMCHRPAYGSVFALMVVHLASSHLAFARATSFQSVCGGRCGRALVHDAVPAATVDVLRGLGERAFALLAKDGPGASSSALFFHLLFLFLFLVLFVCLFVCLFLFVFFLKKILILFCFFIFCFFF